MHKRRDQPDTSMQICYFEILKRLWGLSDRKQNMRAKTAKKKIHVNVILLCIKYYHGLKKNLVVEYDMMEFFS